MGICNHKYQQATISVTPLMKQSALKKRQRLIRKASLVLRLHTVDGMCNNHLKENKYDYLITSNAI